MREGEVSRKEGETKVAESDLVVVVLVDICLQEESRVSLSIMMQRGEGEKTLVFSRACSI